MIPYQNASRLLSGGTKSLIKDFRIINENSSQFPQYPYRIGMYRRVVTLKWVHFLRKRFEILFDIDISKRTYCTALCLRT